MICKRTMNGTGYQNFFALSSFPLNLGVTISPDIFLQQKQQNRMKFGKGDNDN